jgi:hypothetical protein
MKLRMLLLRSNYRRARSTTIIPGIQKDSGEMEWFSALCPCGVLAGINLRAHSKPVRNSQLLVSYQGPIRTTFA